jgi:DMSO/TMAO reductase YedYZ molybdopterin-dependent catalytic subunit
MLGHRTSRMATHAPRTRRREDDVAVSHDPVSAQTRAARDTSTTGRAVQRDAPDPREAGRPAGTADPRLLIVSASPLNAETRPALHRGMLTPNAAFYVRNHFPAPWIDRVAWRLRIGGDVERPVALTFDDLLAMPSRTLLVTLECAGNGRSAMHPQPAGEPWQYGAASTAEWTGVPLRAVLAASGLAPSASNVVVEGADGGYVAEAGRTLTFARSLPRDQALHPDTLLAYAMNGDALPVEHGFPVRLIVPGWYGVAAVKWVTRITALSHAFDGFFQVDRYVMARSGEDQATATPLTRMRIRSVISEPEPDAELRRGEHYVRGFAWSGAGVITRVEVSVDGGAAWQAAELTSRPERYAWRRWEYRWRATTPGPATLASRAFDAAGNRQPAEPEWNRLGYANNAIRTVSVRVT